MGSRHGHDFAGFGEGERDGAKARRKREAGLSVWKPNPVIPSLRGISRLLGGRREIARRARNDEWRRHNHSLPSRHLRAIAPSRSPLPPWLRTTLVLTFATLAAAGCTSPKGVPSGASLVTEATVKSSFQSPADGMLYLYRTPVRGGRGQLHYSGPILAGQTLVIDPATNQATLDGEPLEVLLPGGDVLYQAYFRRDASVRRAVASASARSSDTRGMVTTTEQSPRGATTRASPMEEPPRRSSPATPGRTGGTE